MVKVGDIIEVIPVKGFFLGMLVRGEVINVEPIVIRFFYDYGRHEIELPENCEYKIIEYK